MRLKKKKGVLWFPRLLNNGDLKPLQGSGFKVQDVYDHAGRTRAAIRGFIKYLITYEQDRRKKVTLNPER